MSFARPSVPFGSTCAEWKLVETSDLWDMLKYSPCACNQKPHFRQKGHKGQLNFRIGDASLLTTAEMLTAGLMVYCGTFPKQLYTANFAHCNVHTHYQSTTKVMGVNHAPQESIGVLISLFQAFRWRTTNVCDAWPVRHQTYGYLPSRKASPPIGWYQIILLGDRGTRVLTTCPGLHSTAGRPGFELATYWSQVRHPTATPPSNTTTLHRKTNVESVLLTRQH